MYCTFHTVSNLSYQTPHSVQMLPAQTNTAEWERLFSTTKCCIPARKSENSPEAPSVFVGLEVDDAETIGKPQWDGIGPGFVWINTFQDYLVCQSTATCFLLFKHWGWFSLKLHRNKKKREKTKLSFHMLKTSTLKSDILPGVVAFCMSENGQLKKQQQRR